MCSLTVSSIGLLIYCLADVDQTHTGFMRIPVERLDRLDFVGRAALTGDGVESATNGYSSGFKSAMILAKSIKKQARPRRSSMPVLQQGISAAKKEQQGSSSLLPGTPTRKESPISLSGSTSMIPSWPFGMKRSSSGNLSREGSGVHSSAVSLPISAFAGESNPQVPNTMVAMVKRKSNAILLAKDAFASHTKGEINVVAAINDTP